MCLKNAKSNLPHFITLLRPKQWIKNIFVLAPLIFSGQFIHPSAIKQSIIAVLLFCLASSSTYIINDILDVESDKKHPKKSKTRPIAAGLITKNQALFCLSLLYFFLVISALIMPNVLITIGIYLVINIAYSLTLKHQPVIDIFIIAFGFVLRIYAGAMALSVPVSTWMFVTTLCLALYLATIKRKQELVKHGNKSRKVLTFYTVPLLEKYAQISATGTLLFYSLFVVTARPKMVLTIPIVIFGLFRYWFITETQKSGESPADLLYSDLQLAVTVLAWFLLSLWSLPS